MEDCPDTASAFFQFTSFGRESLQNASGSFRGGSSVSSLICPAHLANKGKGWSSHWNGDKRLYYSLAIMSHLL